MDVSIERSCDWNETVSISFWFGREQVSFKSDWGVKAFTSNMLSISRTTILFPMLACDEFEPIATPYFQLRNKILLDKDFVD